MNVTRIKKLFLYIALFFFFYNIAFQKSVFLATGRLSLIVIVILFIRKIIKEIKPILLKKEFFLLITTLLFLSLHSFMLYWFQGKVDSTQLLRNIYFIFFTVLGSIVFSILFNFNRKELLKAFCIICFIQSLLIIYSYYSFDFRLWTSQILIQGGNIPLTQGIRVAGFTNSSGSSLSLKQFVGFFAALYLMKGARKTGNAFLLFVIAIVILMSTILTGRLGFSLCLVVSAIFVLCVSWKMQFKTLAVLLLMLLLLVINFNEISVYVEEKLPMVPIQKTTNWAFEIFNYGEIETINTLKRMPIPPISIETIIGTGRVRALYWGHDSGYIQTYYAMGLPAALIFYIVFVCFCISLISISKPDWYGVLLLIIILITEIKEPFIFSKILAFFLFAFLLCKKLEYDQIKT